MANKSQALPPKMLAEFVKLAKEGQFLIKMGSNYTLIRGNQIIEVVAIKEPYGSVRKALPGEIDRLKADAKRLAREAAEADADTEKAIKATA